jgi:hypothetical protein
MKSRQPPCRYRPRTQAAVLALLACALLAGCNRAEAPGAPQAKPAPAAAAPAPAATPGTPEAAAASLPPSTTATSSAPAAGASDGKETDPKGQLTKKEESQSMPEAQQANNHSSPALDTEAKKP